MFKGTDVSSWPRRFSNRAPTVGRDLPLSSASVVVGMRSQAYSEARLRVGEFWACGIKRLGVLHVAVAKGRVGVGCGRE